MINGENTTEAVSMPAKLLETHRERKLPNPIFHIVHLWPS